MQACIIAETYGATTYQLVAAADVRKLGQHEIILFSKLHGVKFFLHGSELFDIFGKQDDFGHDSLDLVNFC